MIRKATASAIRDAAHILQSGDLVAFPTETVYGLGADATQASAVQRIYDVKGRPAENPLIVHVASIEEALQLVDLSDQTVRGRFEKLRDFWPGPLTVVLPRGSNIPEIVTAGLATLAVRIPGDAIALELLRATKRPIAAPSANRSGFVSPTTAEHVQESLGDEVRLILDGGPCDVGIESTIVSLVGQSPKLLRPGVITAEQLSQRLGSLEVPTSAGGRNGSSQHKHTILAPGMMAKHYAPRTRLVFRGVVDPQSYPPRVGLISFSRATDHADQSEYASVVSVSATGKLEEVAAGLFRALREMDKHGLDLIVVDTCPDEGIGRAIMDRLRRAAA